MKEIKTIGVFVGRFQTSMITPAHAILIDYIRHKNDLTLIVVGESQTRLTNRNPLPAEARMLMIKEMYDENSVDVISVTDQQHDSAWSSNLDKLVDRYIKDRFLGINQNADVTFYCGRDGFKQYYSGTNKVVEVDNLGLEKISATEVRKQIHSKIKNSVEWREGVIYASAHRYPTSFQAVDVAIMWTDGRVLLGKKRHENNYRFIGGFVDVQDRSLEFAANREVKEECGNIETSDYRYITSLRINDWRYRNETDKIMTAFYCCKLDQGTPVACDDIAEVNWFDPNSDIPIQDEHIPLLNILRTYLSTNK